VDFGDIGNVGLPFRAEVVAGGVGVVGGQGDFQQALLVLVVSGGGGRSTSGTRSSRTRAAPEETATSAQTGGGVRARRGGARRRTVRGEAALCDLLGVDVAAVVNARRRRARDLRRTGITGTAAGVLRRVFRHHYIRYDEVAVYVRHYSSTVTWHSTTAHGFRHQDGPTGQVGGVSRAPFTRVSLDFHSCTTFFAPLS
jgi:hypothetical protein